jgi:hypothetical protein
MKNLAFRVGLNSRLTLRLWVAAFGTTVLYADSSAQGLFDAVRRGNM